MGLNELHSCPICLADYRGDHVCSEFSTIDYELFGVFLACPTQASVLLYLSHDEDATLKELQKFKKHYMRRHLYFATFRARLHDMSVEEAE